MSLQPKIRRILTLPVSTTAPPSPPAAVGIPRHLTPHPVLPLVAYALFTKKKTTATTTTEPMMIVVQDVVTNEVTFSISWHDLYAAYLRISQTPNTPNNSTTTGTSSMSQIQSTMGIHIKSLQFYDRYTLYWSCPSHSNGSGNCSHQTPLMTSAAPIPSRTLSTTLSKSPTPQILILRTEKCILFINLRRGCHNLVTAEVSTSVTSPPVPVWPPLHHNSGDEAILHGYCNERTLRTTSNPSSASCVPSSNILPLSASSSIHHNYVLIGCSDGTMKVIDYTNNTIIKRIKGLGKSDYVIQLLYANSYQTVGTSATTVAVATTTASTTATPKRILTVTKKGYIYMIEIMIHDDTNQNADTATTDPAVSSSSWTMDVLPPMARFYAQSSSSSTDPNPDDTLTATAAGSNATTAGNDSADLSDSIDHHLCNYDPHLDKFYWYVPAATTSSSSSSSSTGTTHTANTVDLNGPILYVWDFKSIFRHYKSNVGSDEKTPMLKPEPTVTIRFPSIVTLGHSNLLSPPTPTTMTAATTTSTSSNAITASSTAGGVISDMTTMTTPSKDDGTTATATSTVTTAMANTKITLLTGVVHPAFHEDTVVSITVSSTGDVCLYGAAVINTNNASRTISAAPCMAIHIKQMVLKQLLQYNDDTNIQLMIEQIELKVYGATSCTLQSPSNCGPCITIATSWGIFYLELPIHMNPNVHSRCTNGNRIVHYGAGLGSYGKSIITVQQNSYITYASIDILQGNPIGYIEPKNVVKIYESHNNSALISEHQRHRPFRYVPILLPSPSGNYICFFHQCEYRYEIYTASSLIQQVGHARAMAGKNNNAGSGPADVLQHRNLMVASGTGICDFAWISDDDLFAVLHASDLQEYMHMNVPKQSSDTGGLTSPNLKFINAGMGAATSLAKTVTKTATTTAQSATKLATSAAVTTTTKTVGVTTKAIMSGAKGVKKTLGIFGKRKKDDASGAMSMTTSVDEDDEIDDTAEMSTAASTKTAAAAAMIAMQQQQLQSQTLTPSSTLIGQNTRQRYIELRKLELTNIETTAVVEAGMPLATCTSLGNVSLRGGNRKLPTMIFGGPVLCVASISDTDEKKDGYGHFYSRNSATGTTMSSDAGSTGSKILNAAMYQATGPVLPYPDLVVWDDDGILCAIVVENRIMVYVSNEPNFELLGTVRIGSPTLPMAEITHLKFVHGALFCCTYNSVHCVMLGDIEGTSICRFDTYLLASSDVVTPTENQSQIGSGVIHPLVPIPLALPLILPTIMGYQSGSLFVSTLRGIYAIPLTSPLVRIGLLLAGGQTERAAKWFDAVDQVDHETLASFLERRGHPELALQLYGISLETIVDISMRYGYIDRLEDAVETYGVLGLRAIDMGRGVAPNIFGQEEEIWNDAPSVVVCVGAYLLAYGRVELARRLATECLRSGEQGQRDALFLGALLLPVDESDATRLIQRAVMEDHSGEEPSSKEWLMGKYVRDFVLRSNSTPN